MVNKKIKAVRKLAKQVKAGNKAFKRMSKAEKRVAIAKDVLAMLKKGKIKARTGAYVATTGQQNWFDEEFQQAPAAPNADLRNELRKIPQCTVCGIGGLFVAAVERFNKINVGDAYCIGNYGEEFKAPKFFSDDSLRVYLSKWFDLNQIDEVEFAFERGGVGLGTQYAEDFGMFFSKDSDCMIAIMKNIIRNKGAFKPELDVDRMEKLYGKLIREAAPLAASSA